MLSTRVFSHKGNEYKVSCVEGHQNNGGSNASWWSHIDEGEVRNMFWNINPGDIVFDIGAAYGSYTFAALACGAEFCFAWSPQFGNDCFGGENLKLSEMEIVESGLKLNGWSEKVKVFNEGVYDKDGYLNTNSQEFFESYDGDLTGDIIRVRSMDSVYEDIKSQYPHLFNSQPRQYWVKMDVEGAEAAVFRRSSKILTELRPNILVENHLFKDPNIDKEVRSIVLSHNYTEIGTVPYHSVSHSFYVSSF